MATDATADKALRATAQAVHDYVKQHPQCYIASIVTATKLNFRTVRSAITLLKERGHLDYTRVDRLLFFVFPDESTSSTNAAHYILSTLDLGASDA